jgi:hypothetical protein
MLSRFGYIIQHPYSVKISWWLDTVPGLIYNNGMKQSTKLMIIQYLVLIAFTILAFTLMALVL